MRTPFKFCFLFLFLIGISFIGRTQSLNFPSWDASWIAVQGESAKKYGIYKFRKSFDLDSKPSSFLVDVSADNRYKLFVNGELASLGPARGDVYFWNYETVDLAPYLKSGKNIIAALVWNEGDLKPMAQISLRTGFILRSHSDTDTAVHTDQSWRGIRDSSYQPLPVRGIPGYYVAGPGEIVDMKKHVAGWLEEGYDDSGWKEAQEIVPGYSKGASPNGDWWWMLVPSPLPQMELRKQRLAKIRRAEGAEVVGSFPAAKTNVTIPAHTEATMLLDQTYLTNAYPTLIFSGGKNARISLGYAESLYKVENSGSGTRLVKGNRNIIKDKIFVGRKDSIISNGSSRQNFTSLRYRTYRYILLKVQTENEPLVVNDIYGTFTGYPFEYAADFESERAELQKILDIGWRTARLCAHETYMDTPYYEQLQYIGDTRIQALISYFNSGDDRLARNAITQLDHSRIAEGITLSRYPTAADQQIPPFSLWWIGMLHDYWIYRPDSDFVKDKLSGSRQVLAFFRRYQQPDGSLKGVPYWNFTDWVEGHGWQSGIPPKRENGNSSILDLQLLWAYQIAGELESTLGMESYADRYNSYADQLKTTIQQKYWDASEGMYADTPEKELFSQHANSLAILTNMVAGSNATALAKKMLNDPALTPASIYFKYYLHQALTKAGLGDGYLEWLDVWRKNIELGLTTWGEDSSVEDTRSDSHAWGSSPNIELFRIVLGIDSAAPGFARVKIEPHLGALKRAGGTIPHPNGKIAVEYIHSGKEWQIRINLPEQTSGYLLWEGQKYTLKSGQNSFRI